MLFHPVYTLIATYGRTNYSIHHTKHPCATRSLAVAIATGAVQGSNLEAAEKLWIVKLTD